MFQSFSGLPSGFRIAAIALVLLGLAIGINSWPGLTPHTYSGETDMPGQIEALQGEWIVTEIENVTLFARPNPELSFEGKTLRGSGPCRTFVAGATQNEGRISIAGFTNDGAICDEATMEDQRTFETALMYADRVETDGENGVVLYQGDTFKIRARRPE